MHTIRLRGPWECRLDGGDVRSIRLPLDDVGALVAEAQQACLFERRFHRPTGIERATVHLMVQLRPFTARVSLNGEWLGTTQADKPTRFPIAAQLTDHNLIQLEFDLSGTASAAGTSVLEVSLEIESDA
jgi:hypothetical protein